MQIVFMGTSTFAVPALKKLINTGFEIAGVVTQPDRPRGRGKQLAVSPVKATAMEYGLPIYQPLRIKSGEAIEYIADWQPELIITASYGQIIPPAILEMPAAGCINIHASLLPRYRGAAPIQRCLMAGEDKTGVTIMFMDEGLDTGDILLQQEVAISDAATFGQLHDELALVGAELLMTAIKKLQAGDLAARKQDESAATYASMLKKEDEIINWQKEARQIFNQIRALDPQPGAFTLLEGQNLKIFKSRIVQGDETGRPGEITAILPVGFIVKTGEGSLEILEVQRAGKKRIEAGAFLKGSNLSAGMILGSQEQTYENE